MNYLKCTKKLIESFGYRDVTSKHTIARTSEVLDFTRGKAQITIDGPNIRYLESGTGIIKTKLDDINLVAVLAYSILPERIQVEITSQDIAQKLEEISSNPQTAGEKYFVEKAMQVLYQFKIIRQESDC